MSWQIWCRNWPDAITYDSYVALLVSATWLLVPASCIFFLFFVVHTNTPLRPRRPTGLTSRRPGAGGTDRSWRDFLFSFCFFFRRYGGEEIREPYCDGSSGLGRGGEGGFCKSNTGADMALRAARSRII